MGHIQGFNQSLANSLLFRIEKYSALVVGYVFMPTHIHLILVVEGDRLPGLMRDFKKYAAQKIARDLNLGQGGLWKPRYDRLVVYSEKVLQAKLDYIHYNPVKGGLVKKPEDWRWSSAGDYLLDMKGMIPIYKNWA